MRRRGLEKSARARRSDCGRGPVCGVCPVCDPRAGGDSCQGGADIFTGGRGWTPALVVLGRYLGNHKGPSVCRCGIGPVCPSQSNWHGKCALGAWRGTIRAQYLACGTSPQRLSFNLGGSRNTGRGLMRLALGQIAEVQGAGVGRTGRVLRIRAIQLSASKPAARARVCGVGVVYPGEQWAQRGRCGPCWVLGEVCGQLDCPLHASPCRVFHHCPELLVATGTVCAYRGNSIGPDLSTRIRVKGRVERGNAREMWCCIPRCEGV